MDIAGQRCWLLRASDLGNATATFALANSHIDNAPTNVTLGLVLLERMAEAARSRPRTGSASAIRMPGA